MDRITKLERRCKKIIRQMPSIKKGKTKMHFTSKEIVKQVREVKRNTVVKEKMVIKNG